MEDRKSNIGETKTQNLKDMYHKYTNYIINLEKHITRIFEEWVIDTNNRNFVLQQLDNMLKTMIKIYNINLLKIYREYGDVAHQVIISINDNIPSTNILKDGLYFLNLITKTDEDDPFRDIRQQLISLSKTNGSWDMDGFLDLFIGRRYKSLLRPEHLKLFDLYNTVYIPLGISIQKVSNSDYSSNFIVESSKILCDGLIDNTCNIHIPIKDVDMIIIFEGYVSSGVLGIHARTSQICSRYLFEIKSKFKSLINEKYPEVDPSFINRYIHYTKGDRYFVYNSQELTEKLKEDFDFFRDITFKNPNLVIKDFLQSDVKRMFDIINLLLMGTTQNTNTASFLYNLLKDKKISGDILGDIIFHNLSFHSQLKLKNSASQLKSELARIRKLTPEHISIEKKLASLVNMPDNVKSYIMEKINEIKTGENSYKLQTAINGLMMFPWKPVDAKNEFTEIKISMVKSRNYLRNVAKKLDENVYGHENSKKVLVELVGKWIQNPTSTGQVIGLVGPPGIGKTLLAKSISSALGLPLSIVGLGGMNDSADLIGHSFTYAQAQYGMIIRQMIKAGNWRCVMFFDEVDKVSKRTDTNEIYNTLIHITDPNMNQHFQDRFYSSSIDFDLSGVLIVFSYNDSSKLDPILLDRIKEINISAYSVQEKIVIARDYILKELCDSVSIPRNRINIDDKTLRYIVEKYTLEAGVRELRRKLEQILLKMNIDRFYMRGPFKQMLIEKYFEQSGCDKSVLDSDSDTNITTYVNYRKNCIEEKLDDATLNKIFNLEDEILGINIKLVHRYLEKPTLLTQEIHEADLVGVVNGLYATSVGMGGITPIQIYKNYVGDSQIVDSANVKLKMTGNQLRVMRESVICALTTAISILNNFKKDNLIREFPNGFHVHIPDGGTPKDGPSAGCAFTTAFISIILGLRVNRKIAMTGEIDLTGKISKIGGLDAKLFGAKKAGVTTVLICEENKNDYLEIKKKNPELFDDDFNIQIVNHILDIVTNNKVLLDVDTNDFDQSELLKNESRNKKNLPK